MQRNWFSKMLHFIQIISIKLQKTQPITQNICVMIVKTYKLRSIKYHSSADESLNTSCLHRQLGPCDWKHACAFCGNVIFFIIEDCPNHYVALIRTGAAIWLIVLRVVISGKSHQSGAHIKLRCDFHETPEPDIRAHHGINLRRNLLLGIQPAADSSRFYGLGFDVSRTAQVRRGRKRRDRAALRRSMKRLGGDSCYKWPTLKVR
jgi:hypothetical protein